MNWELVSQIATTIGVLFTAGSVYAVFRLYRITKRDEYIAALRKTLADTKATADKINFRADYELLHELASSVVNSPDLEYVLEEMYWRFFSAKPRVSDDSEPASPPSNPNSSKEDLRTYLKETLKPITTPVRSPIADSYEDALDRLDAEVTQYQTDYPCLYRVLRSTNAFLARALRSFKDTVRDDDAWEYAIVDIAYDQKDKMESPTALKYNLTRIFTLLGVRSLQHTQPRIDNYLALLTLITERYTSKTESELVSISHQEKAQNLTPIAETEKITDDLREAQKGLSVILDSKDLVEYSNLVTRIEESFRQTE